MYMTRHKAKFECSISPAPGDSTRRQREQKQKQRVLQKTKRKNHTSTLVYAPNTDPPRLTLAHPRRHPADPKPCCCVRLTARGRWTGRSRTPCVMLWLGKLHPEHFLRRPFPEGQRVVYGIGGAALLLLELLVRTGHLQWLHWSREREGHTPSTKDSTQDHKDKTKVRTKINRPSSMP